MSNPSSNQDEPELKGGHPPAVKVAGGVRITQNKHEGSGEAKSKDEVDEEKKQNQIASAAGHDQRALVDGALVKGDKDFTKEAIKSFHDKPGTHPTHEPPHKKPVEQVFQPQRH